MSFVIEIRIKRKDERSVKGKPLKKRCFVSNGLFSGGTIVFNWCNIPALFLALIRGLINVFFLFLATLLGKHVFIYLS